MRNVMKAATMALLLVLALLTFTACAMPEGLDDVLAQLPFLPDSIQQTQKSEEPVLPAPEKPEETPPEVTTAPSQGEAPEVSGDPDEEIDHTSFEIVDGEVFAYDARGKRVDYDRCFVEHEGETYYAIKNIVVVGNYVVEGRAYHFAPDGAMKKNALLDEIFIECENATYYVLNNITVSNMIVIDGAIYDFGEDGKMVTGEKDGYTYGADGKLVANEIFITVNNYVYYIVNNITVNNMIVIDGAIYDFGEDGKMVTGETEDGTYDEEGKLVADRIFVTIGDETFYMVNNVAVTDTYMVIDGRVYYFTESGARLESAERDGYSFGADGYIVSDFGSITIDGALYIIIDSYAYGSAVIDGTVRESDGDRDETNNPLLSGAYCAFEIYGKVFSATTDASGIFTLGNVPVGTGTLTLRLEGYIDVSVSLTVSEDRSLSLVMDRNVSNNLTGRVLIADADNSISNNAALAGALVTLDRTTGTNALYYETTTDSYGNYTFNNLTAGMYRLTIEKDGYLTVEQTVQVAYNQTTVYNVAIEAIASVEDAADGYASGTVTDARTGLVVSGLSVYIYAGINNIDGEYLSKVTTNASGVYKTEALRPGNYTAYIVDERELADEDYRYGSLTVAVKVLSGVTVPDQGATVSNSVGLSIDGMRIVLTWGSTPRDLDSHLMVGSKEVFYGNKTYGNCSLDVDDTSAYGPETITISTIENYTYRYFIYNYTGSGTMASAQAVVTVYFGASSTPAYTFYAPTGSGRTWNVFSYNAVTGEFTVQNTLS